MHKFMNKELGWKDIQANTTGHSIRYLMKEPYGKRELTLEVKADDSCSITFEHETRTIPSRHDIGIALNLNRDATKLEQGRILSQVIDELLRRHRNHASADVEDTMQRYERGHL